MRSDCYCFQIVDGETRCGQFTTAGFSCTQCTDDTDCGVHGADAYCVDGDGQSCCPSGGRFCAVPCDTDPPGTCAAEADSCADVSHLINCNGRNDCYCIQIAGEVRCLANTPAGACDQCETDQDCIDIGVGNACLLDDRIGCTCEPGQKGFCMVDCPPFEDFAPLRRDGAVVGQESRGRMPPSRRGRRSARKDARRRHR